MSVSDQVFEALTRRIAERDAEIERLRRIVWEQVYEVHLTDRMDFYPCLLCGYNGPGFWQREQHPCVGLGDKSASDQPPVTVCGHDHGADGYSPCKKCGVLPCQCGQSRGRWIDGEWVACPNCASGKPEGT